MFKQMTLIFMVPMLTCFLWVGAGAQCANSMIYKLQDIFTLIEKQVCWPSSEKMKLKCDTEVKKSKSEVMLGLHFSFS